MSTRQWFGYGLLAGIAYAILRNPAGCFLWLMFLAFVGLIGLWVMLATIGPGWTLFLAGLLVLATVAFFARRKS